MGNFVIENIRISLKNVKSHLLRTILTVLIIAFGITALVGILTAIDSIKYSITSSFTRMGANSFTIVNRQMRFGGPGQKRVEYKAISYNEAIRFKNSYHFPGSVVSAFVWASGVATLKYESEKTNPNIGVLGIDENYLMVSGYELDMGRNFSATELESGSAGVILGSELKTKLFKNKNPLGKEISIGNGRYYVIGVLKAKGSGMGMSSDKNCFVPLNHVRQKFSRPNMSFIINVQVNKPEQMDLAIGEATATFRVVRGLFPWEENNFEINKSDNLVKILIENIKYVTLAATIIGLITLLGAAVGLMNIMLVSVTERTREIGIRKALGATPRIIRNQFLTEAIVICQLGGILGIILGIIAGNLTSLLTGASFFIPWIWIIFGIILCIIVGLVSGLYPAMKAARLDPIESLRFE